MQIENWEDTVIFFTSAFIMIAPTPWDMFIGIEMLPFSLL